VTYLSVCAIFRDEADYLEEWIEFHRLVGVERFFLYDNGSVDDSRNVLARYAGDDTVQLRDWPGPQYAAYDDCLARHGGDSRWIAFIDLDEFLFSPLGTPLPEMLARYERWPAVGVHWCVFGGSGYHMRPDGLVIESYLDHTTDPILNRWIKSIVDPAQTMRCLSSHAFRHRADRQRAYAVDEQQRLLNGSNPGWSNDISFDLLRINHYWTKSRAEWERKLARPDAMHGGDRRFAALRWEQVQEMLSQARDETITAYAPALRRALGRAPEARSTGL
jgi:glycosyltransferase involved in cell wall biosynthesis